MQFNKIIGQAAIKQALLNSVKSNRIAHAQLFLGNEGVGALPLTLAYIQYILCEQKLDDDSCGTCSVCKKVQKLIHPDIHFTMPVVKNPAIIYKTGETAYSLDWINDWRKVVLENAYLNYNDWMQLQKGETGAQGNITARECGDVLNFLSLKSFESGYKFVIIWMAEYLGNDGNRLLKQIEEPSENTFIFVIAENYEQILGTIQSRTQLVKIAPLTDADIKAGLINQKQIEEPQAHSIAALADGNFNLAQKLVFEKNDQIEQLFLDWMQVVIRRQYKDWALWAEQLAKLGRENLKHFSKYGLLLIRQTLLHQQLEQSVDLWNEREKAYCGYLAKKLNPSQLQTMMQLFNQMHFEVERNANAKILVMHNNFELAKLFL